MAPVSPSCASGVSCEWKLTATNTGAVQLDVPEIRLSVGALTNGQLVALTNLSLVSSSPPPGANLCSQDRRFVWQLECKGASPLAPGAALTAGLVIKGDAPAKIEAFEGFGFVEGKVAGKDRTGGATAAMRAGGGGAPAVSLPSSTAGVKAVEETNTGIFVQLKTTPPGLALRTANAL